MTDSRSRSDPLSELDAWTRSRVRAAGLAAALAVAVILAIGGPALRQPLFDAYQRLLPPPRPSDRIAVVVVDAPSIAALGGWPWSRYVLARLTEELGARGAKAIGYDFLFPERDRQSPQDFANLYPELSPATRAEVMRQPSMDAVFARVIGRNPVVLARLGVRAASYDALDRDGATTATPIPPEAQFAGPVPPAIPSYPAALANLDILDGAAAGHGLANGPPDADGVVRRVPLLGRVAGVLTPSLALDLVRVSEGQRTIRLLGDRSGLTAIAVGPHVTPVEPGGQAVLRMTGSAPGPDGEPRMAYPAISAVDLFRKGFPDHQIRGRIVLVGLAAAGTSDVVNVVRDGRTYGVFAQAQAVDAILRGGTLRQPAWAVILEWSAALGAVLLSWSGVPRASFWLVAAGAVAEIAAAFAASIWAFQNDILLDPIVMLTPGAATSSVTVVLLFLEGRRVQRRLRSALEDERLSAARISGELAAASEIQSGMLLPRHALATITPAVEIDAVLQPARTVGGDLYDAFLMDAGRLCFLVGDVTGKGVPASLFMALSKALSRSLLLRPGIDLGAAVAGINAELSRDNGQAMAVSLLVGVLHLADGRLELVCAGHDNPLVVDAEGRVRELPLDGGPALCVDEFFPYPVETQALAAGEVLLAFTDGLTEAQDAQGQLFGRVRLSAALAQAGRAARLSDLVDRVVAQVRAFEAGGEPSDDLTVLALRRCEPSGPSRSDGSFWAGSKRR